MLYNTAHYYENDFTDNLIRNELRANNFKLKNQDLLYLYGLQKHTLNDQRDIYSLGLGVISENYEWFHTKFLSELPGEAPIGTVLSIWFQVEDKTIVHQRTVFNWFDLLSNVGGL